MMKKLGDVIDSYFTQKKDLHTAFGYDPNLAEESPFEDQRRMHWMLVDLGKSGEYPSRPSFSPERNVCVFSTEPFTKDSIAAAKILFGGPVGSCVKRMETHVLVGIVPRAGFDSGASAAIRYSAVRGQVLTIFDAALECKDAAVKAEYVKCWGRRQ